MSNPASEEYAYWQAALEAYHLDLMTEAWEQIEPSGIGEAGSNIRWYRLIEAEQLLRTKSRMTYVSPWLTLETVPEETVSTEENISKVVLTACDRIAERLDWTHGPSVMISILCRESERPWATNPHGYWVNKEPYDKICLPHYLLDDESDLMRAVAHEYAHVIAGGLSDEHAPTWLHEAISVLAEEEFGQENPDPEDDRNLPFPWLPPALLERVLENENPDDPEAVFAGYQQCGWIGRYLTSLAPTSKLGELLRAHADESILLNLVRLMKGQERIDSALRSVYGCTVPTLFKQARTWKEEADAQVEGTKFASIESP